VKLLGGFQYLTYLYAISWCKKYLNASSEMQFKFSALFNAQFCSTFWLDCVN
jgi:hypothetical protein